MAAIIKNPIFPLNKVVSRFLLQTMRQIEMNEETQAIYPTLVYPHYDKINKERERRGKWFSTGEGSKSFHGQVLRADTAGNVTISVTFNDYMRFVDMGVGYGTGNDEVQNAKKAYYTRKYERHWDRFSGRSHRPAIMMELRHLTKRIRDYLEDFYGYEGETRMLRTFQELGEITL